MAQAVRDTSEPRRAPNSRTVNWLFGTGERYSASFTICFGLGPQSTFVDCGSELRLPLGHLGLDPPRDCQLATRAPAVPASFGQWVLM